MKLAVNYLREVQELFEEGKIDFVDYFKLYSLSSDLTPLDWCLDNKAVLFHGVVGKASMFGDKDLVDTTDIEKTKDVLERTKAPYISGHIFTGNLEQTKEETLNAIQCNIKKYREIFNKEVVLENIPYRDYYSHCLYLIEPEMISKIVYEANCDFLFDISHARKAAIYLQMSFDEYISKLPMDKMVEMHLAGMYTYPDGTQVDNHGVMHEEDYLFLKDAIKKYPSLQYITLEYGSICLNGKTEDEMPYPVASFEKVNLKVKEEVYEQLTRIKQILEEVGKK